MKGRCGMRRADLGASLVGLVTLAYSVLRPKRRVQLRYSTEDVML